jgi:hypothetical protein
MEACIAMTRHRKADNDPGLAELGLILGLFGLVLVVALFFMGGQVSSVLYTVSGSV